MQNCNVRCDVRCSQGSPWSVAGHVGRIAELIFTEDFPGTAQVSMCSVPTGQQGLLANCEESGALLAQGHQSQKECLPHATSSAGVQRSRCGFQEF